MVDDNVAYANEDANDWESPLVLRLQAKAETVDKPKKENTNQRASQSCNIQDIRSEELLDNSNSGILKDHVGQDFQEEKGEQFPKGRKSAASKNRSPALSNSHNATDHQAQQSEKQFS